ncbi:MULTISPECIES: glycosyltransferase [Vibrio]|uniref:glycosyltransferase n=1 Tax=Vibrio TaxID=662 RepID=UPI000B5CF032|nr:MULTISPECIES: glycosyltransferase [Vibrio]HBV76740.1 hypothetical protein [Vibrio sp.]
MAHWKYTDRIYVSCICPAYNQEEFISETIESFLSQITEYKFEIIIHDDKSTDNTLKIINKYQEKYPKLIRIIENKVNQYSIEPSRPILNLLNNAQGEYICICEGDDFWTSNSKIQEQYQYLASNHDCSMHVFDTKIIDENGNLISDSKQNKFKIEPGIYNKKRMNEKFIFLTLSVMFRKNDVLPYPQRFSKIINMDSMLQILLSYKGYAYIDNKVCCAYRVTSQGVWSQANNDFKDYSNISKLIELNYFYKENNDITLANDAAISIIFQIIKSNSIKGLTVSFLCKLFNVIKNKI